MGNFSMGMSEVQTFLLNQLHNDDIMNWNGGHTDGWNEQVTEDDIMNVNRQCTDDLADELKKMSSMMHQMMSQENQVEETTPG